MYFEVRKMTVIKQWSSETPACKYTGCRGILIDTINGYDRFKYVTWKTQGNTEKCLLLYESDQLNAN